MLKTNNMLNKQIGGYGLRVSNEAGEEVKNSPIRNAQEKTEDLINANPNGTTITKFSDSINDQLTQYLPMKKQELAELEKIKALGSGAEGYNEAIDGINNIEKGLIQLNNDFEQSAARRQQLLDMEINETYANSNTDEQAANFHNFANGTFSEEAQIIEDEMGMPRLMYAGKLHSDINTGGGYNFELENLIDTELFNTRELAHGEGAIGTDKYNNITRPNLEKDLNKLVKNKDSRDAVKDYMYQNPELIDAFISNQTGKQITPEYKETPEYNKLYNLNKTNVNFSYGFVETVLAMHDAEFQKRESKEVKPKLTAEEIIKKFS